MNWGPNCIAKTEDQFKANRKAYFQKYYAENREKAIAYQIKYKQGRASDIKTTKKFDPEVEKVWWLKKTRLAKRSRVNTKRLMATKSTEEFRREVEQLLARM